MVTLSKRLGDPEPNPFALPSTIDLGQESGIGEQSIQNGVGKTENADGSLTVDFSPKAPAKTGKENGWFDNLADDIETGELARIASELLEGIQIDDQSRKDWLDTRARGISLLGLTLHEPKSE